MRVIWQLSLLFFLPLHPLSCPSFTVSLTPSFLLTFLSFKSSIRSTIDVTPRGEICDSKIDCMSVRKGKKQKELQEFLSLTVASSGTRSRCLWKNNNCSSRRSLDKKVICSLSLSFIFFFLLWYHRAKQIPTGKALDDTDSCLPSWRLILARSRQTILRHSRQRKNWSGIKEWEEEGKTWWRKWRSHSLEVDTWCSWDTGSERGRKRGGRRSLFRIRLVLNRKGIPSSFPDHDSRDTRR